MRVMAGFRPSGFFLGRAPLLPFNVLTHEGIGLSKRLQEVAFWPEVKEALFLASPALSEKLEQLYVDPESEISRKIEVAIYKYISRMRWRCTPFGLFAGCFIGTVLEKGISSIELAGTNKVSRLTRLDAGYVASLAYSITQAPHLHAQLRFEPNQSLYTLAGKLRFIQYVIDPVSRERMYALISIETTKYLNQVLERARDSATVDDLTAGLTNEYPEVSLEETERFVNSLIEQQILVSQLDPPVVADDAVLSLIQALPTCGDLSIIRTQLSAVHKTLGRLDSLGIGQPVQKYYEIAAKLSELPTQADLSRLFQVDIFHGASTAQIGPDIIRQVEKGVEVLLSVCPPPDRDPLAEFRKAFIARYGEQEVPLLEALDEELGIGFESNSQDPSVEDTPLLQQLEISDISGENEVLRVYEQFWLRKLERALLEGKEEISLNDEDIDTIEHFKDRSILADSFCVNAVFAASSLSEIQQGRANLYIRGMVGPSGMETLGRFCCGDINLREAVRKHLKAEESLHQESIYAELVHLPEGRTGNVILRPVMREHEIRFLGRSVAPKEQSIALSDLFLSVHGSRILLRSAKHNREIIPRLTNAHNFRFYGIGIYRFLCLLQQQYLYSHSLKFSSLRDLLFIPRIVYGKQVLFLATWHLSVSELRILLDKDSYLNARTIHDLRARLHLPRWVAMKEEDLELPLDLEDPLSLKILAQQTRANTIVTLVELFPPPEKLWLQSPRGKHALELVIPFVQSEGTAKQEAANKHAISIPVAVAERKFPPGSEWLYAKIYTGEATADKLLVHVVRPLLHDCIEQKQIDRWFFVRYADPDCHLRLRLHGNPKTLHEHVLPSLEKVFQPHLYEGSIHKIQLETYMREIERYGGCRKSMECSEKLFWIDSELVLNLLKALETVLNQSERWKLALLGVHLLLEDLDLNVRECASVVERLRDKYLLEFSDNQKLKHQLSEKFRKERDYIREFLTSPESREPQFSLILKHFRRRSRTVHSVVKRLHQLRQTGCLSTPIDELGASYIHMFLNRLLHQAVHAQELVIYDLLFRNYRSALAFTASKSADSHAE